MLRDVQFGEISAEVELEMNPDYIEKGFYDFNNVLDKLLNGHQFIVMGNKGTGKSIIGEHIRLAYNDADTAPNFFVSNASLSQFPYKSFKKIIPGQSESESKLPTTWKWIILIYAYKSFNKDHGKECEFDAEFNHAVESLQALGVLPADIHKIALLSSKKTFKAKLPLIEMSNERGNTAGELHYIHIVDYLEKLILSINTENKHYLIIDGLDELLTSRDIQYESIAALITESRQINRTMRENGVPFKIIILCRKDLYKRLPGSNKNKLTNAFKVDLDWYQSQKSIEDKEIVKLAQFRAKTFSQVNDLFNEYFPKTIDGKHPAEYLLENTRFTPRDFLCLLKNIAENSHGETAKYTDIINGIKVYSKDYFWLEIEDELDGYITRDDILRFKKLLTHYNQKSFILNEIKLFAEDFDQYDNLNLHVIFEVLYECGAVSNSFDSNGKPHFQSRMKDDNDFNDQMTIVLHRGMFKALNIS